MPKPTKVKKYPKRVHSATSSLKSHPGGKKSRTYNIPSNSTLDSVGNLVVPPQLNRRSSSLASMRSVRSNSSQPGDTQNINNIQTSSRAQPKPIIVDAGLATINNFLIPLQLAAKPLMKVLGSKKTQIHSMNVEDKAKITVEGTEICLLHVF